METSAVAISEPFTQEQLAEQALQEQSWMQRFRTSRFGKAIIGLATTTSLIGGGLAINTEPAFADTGTVQHVYNTDGEGLWLHPNSPTIHSTVTDRMPDNTEFDVSCWKHGDNVNGDNIWLHGTDKDTGHTGDAADFYIDTNVTQGNEATQLTEQGIQECDTNEPSNQNPMKSVFYSPLNPPGGLSNLLPADINLPIKSWSSGDCSPDMAANVPDSVDTLAGWSIGRLGPVYFLSSATAEQVSNIHRIVLFDPGASSDIEGPSIASQVRDQVEDKETVIPCDTQYDINGLLAGWLESSSSNKLVVLTGQVSEMKDSSGDSKFKALWKSYFAGIWSQDFASQATVCDYNNMSHSEVLNDFAYVVNQAQDSCPDDPTGRHQLTSWHP